MKAFVINEDQIIKAGVGAVVAVILAFFSGYFYGSNSLVETVHLSVQKQPKEKSSLSNANNVIEKTKSTLNPQANKKSEDEKTKLKKDIKKKEANKKEVKKKEIKKKEKPKKDSRKKDPKKEVKKDAKKKGDVKKDLEKNKTAETKAVDNKTTKENVDKKNAGDTDKNKSASVTEEKHYSIQAGMFSNETNANSFIDKLSAKKYDAYLVSFESSSGSTKYNVRVGKYKNREAASDVLGRFQKAFSSPAYVVITQ